MRERKVREQRKNEWKWEWESIIKKGLRLKRRKQVCIDRGIDKWRDEWMDGGSKEIEASEWMNERTN